MGARDWRSIDNAETARRAADEGWLPELAELGTPREVYDLEDLRRSRFIIATGQSGNPVSGHYRDRLTDWRDGRYLRMGKTRADLRLTADILTLTPAVGTR